MLLMVRATSLIILAAILILAGCSSQESQWKDQIGQQLDQASSSLERLERNLSQGTIRNALLLQSYAEALKRQKPEMSEVVNALSQDATWDGPMVKSLQERFKQAKSEVSGAIKNGENDVKKLQGELDSIIDGSSPVLYGLMLSDPINVIADMSNGKLARIESMSKEASMRANGEGNFGDGSQLVGNPNYGNWQQNSSGQSFWAWYGMYSMFSNLMQPIFYSDWSSRRPYSYYSDHGRRYYSSPRQRQSLNSVQTRTEKKFKQQGKTFKSPYAKTKVGGATTASVTKRAVASNFTSRNKKNSKFKSSYSSSQRSSSYKTSRSFGSGK